MKIFSTSKFSRRVLGTVSRSTQGSVRGVIEPFGLYTASIRLD